MSHVVVIGMVKHLADFFSHVSLLGSPSNIDVGECGAEDGGRNQ